jgi:hypothetical protein
MIKNYTEKYYFFVFAYILIYLIKKAPCQRLAKLPVGQCALPGGTSTGPRTEAGHAHLSASKTKHGRYTKIEKAKARTQRGRKLEMSLKNKKTGALNTDV